VSSGPGRSCLLNGRVVPFGEARISPLDRGFLFGDAVYEAVKVAGGRLLFLDRHLGRLAASLAAMRIAAPSELAPKLAELVAANALADGVLYLQVTRGVARRRTHLPPTGLDPTVFAMTSAIDYPERPENEPGMAAISRPDDRWGHCDVKTTALAASVLAKLAADDAGAVEAIFVGPGGALREGGNTNLFVRDGDGWHTHPTGPEILAGVTRAVLLEEAARFGIEVATRSPRLGARAGWREAFLCGTTTGVRGLVTLDDTPIAGGEVGAETRRFARWLRAAELAEAERVAAREVR
jgi:D-alanine transaminase